MKTRLFSEFPPVSTDAWMEVATKDLKGQDFNKRLVHNLEDGVAIKPFYRKEDVPSTSPAARGIFRDGSNWAMREEIRESDVSRANIHALRCLASGAEELAWHTYPIGTALKDASDMERILSGIFIQMLPIHWMCGPLAPAYLRLYASFAEKQGLDLAEIRGSVDMDPILDRVVGWVDQSAPWEAEFIACLNFIGANLPSFHTFVVRGSLIEKAGASFAQEIGWAASLYSAYLSVAKDGLESGSLKWNGANPLAEIAKRSEIRLGVGSQFLPEIAKLRAARVVFANVSERFGISGVMPKIHAITTSSTKTLYDPHNNLLRATVESMAGVLGGCDSLSVAAFDQGYHTPDEFSEHLARNTEILLKEEAHLDKVCDPLGGSYAIESLTHSIAEAAWTVLTAAESKGGFFEAWQEGMVSSELLRVKEARRKAANTRRTPLVGTSVFPSLTETRAKDVADRKPICVVEPPSVGVEPTDLSACVTEACADMGAFQPFRIAEDFERLRLQVERSRRRPTVTLVLGGDVVMRRARAGFCQSFFGSVGLEIKEIVAGDPLPPSDLFVLCGNDAEYVTLAESFLSGKPKAPVWVAGLPQESLEVLKDLGIAHFVHARLNPIETLSSLLPTLGVSLS